MDQRTPSNLKLAEILLETVSIPVSPTTTSPVSGLSPYTVQRSPGFRDDSLEDLDNLPAREVIAREMVEDLIAALAAALEKAAAGD